MVGVSSNEDMTHNSFLVWFRTTSLTYSMVFIQQLMVVKPIWIGLAKWEVGYC